MSLLARRSTTHSALRTALISLIGVREKIASGDRERRLDVVRSCDLAVEDVHPTAYTNDVDALRRIYGTSGSARCSDFVIDCFRHPPRSKDMSRRMVALANHGRQTEAAWIEQRSRRASAACRFGGGRVCRSS